MAETQTAPPRRRAKKDAGQAGTQYVVLRAVPVGKAALKALGLDGSLLAEVWAPVLNEKAEQGPDGKVRVFVAGGKSAAIRQYTGDGPDALEGKFRAVPVSSWKGGEDTRRVTAVERKPLEDL